MKSTKMHQGRFAVLLMALLLLLSGSMLAQSMTTISGVVKDLETGDPLPGANVQVVGKYIGVAAQDDGGFLLNTKLEPPFRVKVSMIGYQTQELEVTGSMENLVVEMEPKAFMAGEIVVSASRVEESILTAPVSVEKMDILDIRRSPSVTVYDGLANMKEIEMTANSMTFSGPTGRGIGSSHNTGLIQLIDGVDNTGIANGSYSIGNLTGISDIDVAEIEFLPGASSALYGPNAFSGVLFMNTKSPFDFPGLSVSVKGGGSSSDYGGNYPLYETAFRYAKVVNDRFAFKIVGSRFKATDWYANDFSDKYKGARGVAGYNGVNVYGDEVATNLDLDQVAAALRAMGQPIPDNLTFGKIFVARTGYKEEELYDYNKASSTKFNVGLRYRLSDDIEASYDFRYGVGNAIYQGTNRYALDGINAMFNKLELKGKNFFVRGYTQREGAGDSYDIVFAGWNVNRRWKSDADWFGQFGGAYIGALLQGATPEQAQVAARNFADQGRFQPGSPEFEKALSEVIATKDFATGAGFISKSGFNNFEAMYNFADKIDFVELQVGGNYRNYGVNTAGTIYSDKEQGIDIYEYGAYAQASKRLGEKLKVTGSLRIDGHKNFKNSISPRVAAVFTPAKDHNFRISYQSGFNNPIIESQYINLNLGPIILLGGTQDNMDRTGRTPGNGDVYASAIDLNSLLAGNPQVVSTPFVKPEYQKSFEIGYKSLINQSLFVDINYYRSSYVDRFKSARVIDPATGQVYGLYTNEPGDVIIDGGGIGLTYNFSNGYRVGGSYMYINRTGGSDDFLSSINRPKNSIKLSIGNPRLFKNLGFNIAGRYRSKFMWVATFGEGEVGGETVIDAQLTYKLPSMNATLKAGVNNLTGVNFTQAFGSVTIGRIMYIQMSYDNLFN